jgi:hypothetical protein
MFLDFPLVIIRLRGYTLVTFTTGWKGQEMTLVLLPSRSSFSSAEGKNVVKILSNAKIVAAKVIQCGINV